MGALDGDIHDNTQKNDAKYSPADFHLLIIYCI